MHLTDTAASRPDGRGRGNIADGPPVGPLHVAAELIDVSSAEVCTHSGPNIRAGAALMAQYARQAGDGRLPSSTTEWAAAVARFGSGANPATGAAFVEDVFALLRTGLPELPAVLDEIPECPRNADCRFVPAVYEQTDPSDPNAYGNYDPADRPDDGNDLRYILLHSTESTHDSTINPSQGLVASWSPSPAWIPSRCTGSPIPSRRPSLDDPSAGNPAPPVSDPCGPATQGLSAIPAAVKEWLIELQH